MGRLFKVIIYVPIYFFQIIILLYWIASIHGELKSSPIIVIGSLVAIFTTNWISNFLIRFFQYLLNNHRTIKFNEIKTKKKRLALELLILILSSVVISLLLLASEGYSSLNEKRMIVINENINRLKANPYYERYTFLNEKYTHFDSYEDFKSRIKIDRDTTYSKYLYRLLNESGYYGDGYVNIETFVLRFQNCNIDSIDAKIEALEAEYDSPRVVHNYSEYFSIIIFVIMYPIRFLYYLIRWAIRVLSEN